MERRSTDLPAAPRPRHRDDPRRPAQRRRSAAVRAQRRRRVSGQSPHGPEGLSRAGRRAARREQARSRHVHQCGRAQPAAAGRAPEVPRGAVAAGRRDHTAARPEREGPAGGRRNPLAVGCRRGGVEAMTVIQARGLRKAYGATIALDGVDLRVEEGRILGLIGPNGAGKSTALHAILGLTPYQGDLEVLGRDPWSARDRLMRDVCFIADVALLPRWLRVWQALDYVAGVHPRFDRAKAEGFLARTAIKRTSKVRELSKGMVTQLHLALVMAIDARLLLLDEPTLGLDILFRKQFYDSLLNDYFDRNRTIVLATHQVDEVQHVLTDVVFIDRGRIVLDCSMEEFESRYLEVMAHPQHVAAARALKPIHERQVFGRSILLFDHVDRDQLAALGDVRTPSIADLFVAVMGNQAGAAQGAAT